MIFSEQLIDIGTDKLSDVLASKAQNFKKVSLDTSKISKKEKIYTEYKIPRDENIIAFCNGTIPLLGLAYDGIVFTNKAMYPYPKDSLELGSNRILYTQFCKYLIVKRFDNDMRYMKNRSGIFLHDENGEYEIYDCTIIAKNVAAKELFELLNAIQKELINKKPNAKNEIRETVENCLNSYKNKMRSAEVTPQNDMLLKSLMSDAAYCERAFFLLAENSYRNFEFKAFLDKTSPLVPEELLQKVKNSCQKFINNLISDLSNLNIETNEKYLKTASNVLANDNDSFSEELKWTLEALVAARSSRYHFSVLCIECLKQRYGKDYAEIPENFLLMYGNIKMKSIFQKILNNTSLEEDRLNIRDGLGFTPLHYAILLKNDEYIQSMLEMRDWSHDFKYDEFKSPKFIYHYSVIYYLKNGEIPLFLLKETEESIKELSSNLQALKEQLDEAVHANKDIQYNIRDARKQLNKLYSIQDRGGYCYKEISEMQESLDELINSENDLIDMRSDIQEKILETQALYDDEIERRAEQVVNFCKKMSKESNPFFDLIKYICQNKFNIESIFSELNNDNIRIYSYENISVLLPEAFNLGLPFRCVHISEDGTIASQSFNNGSSSYDSIMPFPIYKNSWFSEAAHTNKKVLSSEFKALAKQYHPDICNKAYANKIFTNISGEYQIIVKNIKDTACLDE